MIESIRIQNYKALRDVTLHLTPIHVLIGKNDSGKTSILEAITALCRSADRLLTHAFTGRWSGHELVCNFSPTKEILFDAHLRESEHVLFQYSLSCRFENDRNCRISSEKIIHKGVETNLTRESASETQICSFSRNLRAENPDHQALLGHVYGQIANVRTCRWTGRMLSLPVAFDGDARPFEQSDTGFGLALALDDILGDNRDRFSQLEQQFRVIFPQVKSIKLVREPGFTLPSDDGKNIPVLRPGSGKGIRFDFVNGMSNVAASQVSDGLLIVLAYLATLFSPRTPRTLLVEEPENGIHPERLVVVIKLLREIVALHNRTQLIITTHSPYLVSHFDAEEVTLCHKEDDGSVSLHRMSDSSAVKKQSSIFTLGEIWTGEGDDLLAKSTARTEPAAP